MGFEKGFQLFSLTATVVCDPAIGCPPIAYRLQNRAPCPKISRYPSLPHHLFRPWKQLAFADSHSEAFLEALLGEAVF